MQGFMDLLTAIVGRTAAPFVGVLLLSSPLWVMGGMYLRKEWGRRRALQDFAAARQLTFVGTIPSDARAPYTRIYWVARAVLLSNVIEGRWDGLPIKLFEMPADRARPTGTTVLVTVEDLLRRGARAEHAIAAGPAETWIDMNAEILCVCAQRRLDPSELPTWLSFAVAVAKAMEQDLKDAVRFDTSGPTPPPKRTLI